MPRSGQEIERFGMKYAIIYSARILALVATTIVGVFFLAWFGLLLWLLYEMPGIITREDVIVTAVLGVVFVCLGILYAVLARRTPSNQPFGGGNVTGRDPSKNVGGCC